MSKRVWETEYFYCTHLGDMVEDDADVRSFVIKHPETELALPHA